MKKFDTINVIPFIDIMLVLLAIVLTTATFISNGQLELDLPRASSAANNEGLNRVEIAIDQNHELFLAGQPQTLESLKLNLESQQFDGKSLGSTQQQQEPDVAILLRIDQSVPFAQFVTVIDLLKALKLNNVSILTSKSSSSKRLPYNGPTGTGLNQ